MSNSSVTYELIAALTETVSSLQASDAVAASQAVNRAVEVCERAVKAGVKLDSTAGTVLRQLHKQCSEAAANLQVKLGDSVMQAGASRRAIGAYGGGQHE
jgi:hypothetical protein